MAQFKFEDYSADVLAAMGAKSQAVLEECSAELESQTKRNSRVDTGNTKNSFQHKVTGSMMAGQYVGYVGSNEENAIWEEFGTGEYALKGNGRKGGWVYKDPQYGLFWRTNGKHPSRAFWNAYTNLKNLLIKRIQDSFKGL